MKNRILKTLEAYLLTNEGALEPEHIQDLKEQIAAVKAYKEKPILKCLKKIFCKHTYEKVGFYEEIEYGIRYSIRIYRCSKCGKVIHRDGRIDIKEMVVM